MNHRMQTRAERTSPRHQGARLYTAVLAACLAISAFGASTAAASHARNGLDNAEALQALKVRSIALNQRYHLGRADARTERKASAATRVRFVRISDFVRGIRIARNASAAPRVRFVRSSDVRCPCNADLPRGWAG